MDGPDMRTDIWSTGGKSWLLKMSEGCIHWDFIFLALGTPINAHHKREPF